MLDQGAHQLLALRERFSVAEIILRDGQQGPPGKGLGFSLIPAQEDRPPLHDVSVALLRLNRSAALRLTIQGQAVTQFLQQRLFEAPQRGLARLADRQGMHRLGISQEQRRMRIFARQQLEQQFIHVITEQQRLRLKQRLAADPFDLGQGAHLALPEPAQFDRLKGHQQSSHRGTGSTGASRNQCNPAVIPAESLDNQAGLAEGMGMQDERRLAIHPALAHRAHS